MRGLFWWIDRWRQSRAYIDMSVEQQGAYRNLLDEATLRDGDLPLDEDALAKACGDPRLWPKVRKAVLSKFTRTRTGYRHKTLDHVLQVSVNRAARQQRYRDRHKRGNGKA